ncbi:NAD(P)-dependent dehydrogenase (short-subunit alcohol dehydrogenase family) [Tamaricihabitans halophyticus]|uniref:NAD(P)-dependent dehydrogenase (Short-subunit alcohol dehydrogenase family) n=1 Tax=Tamaricihabitans halophyticus TaxID=1262583 RepID=A0A4R2QAV1_9PSEU|nr:SDR family oxidoreductase [Tamaricihabitans halophyticus]TCP45729.1 NAD(P)-dependent dehydrogenase (short-subunit alcohol dehydrogenase family) [Tamaricihabitans halophyticus]
MSEQVGRAVIVTGGTRGIGAAIAERFLASGADVLVCGRSEVERLPTSGERTAVFEQADIRQPEQAAAVVAAAKERFGRLDVLVNNAGGAPPADSTTVSPRFVSAVVTLNLLAPFYLAQPAYQVMRDQPEGGQIINIGSVAGRHPAPGAAAYSAAKAGLSMLTRTLGMEFAPKVRVNQVTVGLVHTELSQQNYGDADGQLRVAATIPMARMASPEDVASACLLLTAPEAGYVSGAELLVDGGGEIPARYLAVNPEFRR